MGAQGALSLGHNGEVRAAEAGSKVEQREPRSGCLDAAVSVAHFKDGVSPSFGPYQEFRSGPAKLLLVLREYRATRES